MEDHERNKEAAYLEDDQLAQLSRSHKKTLRMMEEDAFSKDDSDERRPTPRDPQGQIFPSAEEIAAEAFCSKRRETDRSGRRPPDKRSSFRVMSYGNFSKFISDEMVSSDGSDSGDKNAPPRRRHKSQRIAIMVVTLAALVATTIVLAIPKTRNALDRAMSKLAQDTEAALAHSSRQMLLPMSELGGLHGSNPADYRTLLSPVYNSLDNVVPMLWTVPNSGSRTAKDVMSYCMRLIIADERGGPYTAESSLSIRTHSDNVVHFVDADTTTLEGLERADQLGLVESGLADAIATPYIPQAAELFRSKIKTGRTFAVLRHPVERSIADYKELKALLPSEAGFVQAEASNSSTLYDYALSDFVTENIMVKTLANITNGVVANEDVDVARTVLDHFILVGRSDKLEESMERFYDYFGWAREDGYAECQKSFISLRQSREDPSIDEESAEYKALAGRNWADMLLWDSIQHVWDRQGRMDGAVN